MDSTCLHTIAHESLSSQLRPLTNDCMPPRKTVTVTIRIDPLVKEALEKRAEKEHRSFSQLVSLILLRDAEAAGEIKKR